MKLSAMVLCAALGLASSAFSATILSDHTFNSPDPIVQTSTYNGAESQWLTDGGWHKSQDDMYDGTWYAQAGTEHSVLYQVVNYQGVPGDIIMNFWFQKNPSGLNFTIYGSDVKPAVGSSWDTSTWVGGENPFGEGVWGATSSGSAGDDWGEWDRSSNENEAYAWYTVYVKGKYGGGQGTGYDYAKIENVIVEIPAGMAVPEPSVILLFVSGMALLLRRKRG